MDSANSLSFCVPKFSTTLILCIVNFVQQGIRSWKKTIYTINKLGLEMETQLLCLDTTNREIKETIAKKNLDAVFLCKTFNTVNHNILLMKMEHYGIRDLPPLWFESYLSKRIQSLMVKIPRRKKLA